MQLRHGRHKVSAIQRAAIQMAAEAGAPIGTANARKVAGLEVRREQEVGAGRA